MLTRQLSVDELGRFALWGFLLTVLDLFTDFGTGNLTLQRGANDDWAFTSYLKGARRVRSLAFGLGWSVIAVAIVCIEDVDRGWYLLALASPITRRLEASGLALQRKIAWERLVSARVLGALVRAGGVLWLSSQGVDRAAPYLAVVAGSQAFANIAVHIAARSILPRPTINVALPRDLLRASWPLALAGVVQVLHVQLDYVLLRALLGDAALGTYHVAARVYSYFIWIPLLSTQAALPYLSSAYRDGRLATVLDRFGWITGVVVALCLGAVFPHLQELLEFAFSEPFGAAAPALAVLSICALIQASQAWWVTALLASDRARVLLIVTGSALALNLVLNLWLIPSHGLVGAAWATTASELLLGLAAGTYLVRCGSLRFRSLLFALLTAIPFLAARWLTAHL